MMKRTRVSITNPNVIGDGHRTDIFMVVRALGLASIYVRLMSGEVVYFRGDTFVPVKEVLDRSGAKYLAVEI